MSSVVHNPFDPNYRPSVPRGPRPEPQRAAPQQLYAERKIETRLHDLGERIHDLAEAPYPGLLQDRDCIGQALEELTVKHTTLLWIARVAKCTGGSVREKLWWDIDKALTSLEKIAGSLVQS